MTKVALITPDFYPSQTGYSFAFQALSKVLFNYHHVESIAVYNDGSAESNDDRIDVKPLIFKGVNRLFSYFPKFLALKLVEILYGLKLRRLYKELDEYDLVFVETSERGWLSYLLDKNLNVPVVTRLHGAFPEAALFFPDDVPYGKSYFELLLETKNIATTTYHYIDFIKRNCRDYSLLRNKEFFIIPNTNVVETDSYLPRESSHCNKMNILQLGRMDNRGYYYKGFDDVLKALHLLESRNEKLAQRIKYTVIGDGERGEGFKENLARLEFVEGEFKGVLDNLEVKEQILNADLILMPSRNEGMSMFVVECLQMAKPFIFTEGENGLVDVLNNNINGMAIRPFDYVQLASSIEYYEENRDKLMEHGLSSKGIYKERYSNAILGKHLSVLFKKLGL